MRFGRCKRSLALALFNTEAFFLAVSLDNELGVHVRYLGVADKPMVCVVGEIGVVRSGRRGRL